MESPPAAASYLPLKKGGRHAKACRVVRLVLSRPVIPTQPSPFQGERVRSIGGCHLNLEQSCVSASRAPSPPSSSAATASSIDWTSASDAVGTFDCGDGVQWTKKESRFFSWVRCCHSNNGGREGAIELHVIQADSPDARNEIHRRLRDEGAAYHIVHARSVLTRFGLGTSP
jgi:hypothetical protein